MSLVSTPGQAGPLRGDPIRRRDSSPGLGDGAGPRPLTPGAYSPPQPCHPAAPHRCTLWPRGESSGSPVHLLTLSGLLPPPERRTPFSLLPRLTQRKHPVAVVSLSFLTSPQKVSPAPGRAGQAPGLPPAALAPPPAFPSPPPPPSSRGSVPGPLPSCPLSPGSTASAPSTTRGPGCPTGTSRGAPRVRPTRPASWNRLVALTSPRRLQLTSMAPGLPPDAQPCLSGPRFSRWTHRHHGVGRSPGAACSFLPRRPLVQSAHWPPGMPLESARLSLLPCHAPPSRPKSHRFPCADSQRDSRTHCGSPAHGRGCFHKGPRPFPTVPRAPGAGSSAELLSGRPGPPDGLRLPPATGGCWGRQPGAGDTEVGTGPSRPWRLTDSLGSDTVSPPDWTPSVSQKRLKPQATSALLP